MLPNRVSQIAKFRKPCRAPIIAPSRACGLDAIRSSYLQVGIILIGQGHLGGILHLLLVLLENSLVNLDLRRSQSRGSNELQGLVTNKLPGEPEERLLKVVV